MEALGAMYKLKTSADNVRDKALPLFHLDMNYINNHDCHFFFCYADGVYAEVVEVGKINDAFPFLAKGQKTTDKSGDYVLPNQRRTILHGESSC